MATATFTPSADGAAAISFPEVVGYRLSAKFVPGMGFQGNFFVTLIERVGAQTRLNPITMQATPQAFRGTLELNDPSRTYQFDNLDLLSIQPVVDRQYRYRVIEFNYDATVTNAGIRPNLTFAATKELTQSNLGADYFFTPLPAPPKQPPAAQQPQPPAAAPQPIYLLGFGCRQSAADSPAYRFHTYTTERFSWLRVLLAQTNWGQNLTPTFTVEFTQTAAQLVVSQGPTLGIHIDESFGVARAWPLPSLAALAGVPASPQRHEHADPTPLELVTRNGADGGETVDTLTLVYGPQNLHNLPIH